MLDLSKEALRAKFASLSAEVNATLEAVMPLREERDAISHEAEVKVAEMNARIAEIEAGLFEKRQQVAMLARALNGKTG